MSDRQSVVRLVEYGGAGDGERYVKIGGLTEREFQELQGVIAGCGWVSKTRDGRLEFISKFKDLPSQVDDSGMLPFWSYSDSEERVFQTELLDPKSGQPPFSQAIIIKSLCGYHYTSENYKLEAEKLETFGFDCLRSKRGADGRFWEIWYLCGLFAAKGGLGEFLKEKKHKRGKSSDEDELNDAIHYLCGHVSFGTLDIIYQRAAMQIPE